MQGNDSMQCKQTLGLWLYDLSYKTKRGRRGRLEGKRTVVESHGTVLVMKWQCIFTSKSQPLTIS